MNRAIRAGLYPLILLAFVGVVGCASPQRPQESQADGVERAIAEVQGVFAWRDDLGRYDYSEEAKLEEILSTQPPRQAVAALIECLDDNSPSASVVDGKPVPVGIICYEALTQLVYYEPTEPSGDVASDWLGFISPKASEQEMRDAKAAWKRAEEARLLIFQ